MTLGCIIVQNASQLMGKWWTMQCGSTKPKGYTTDMSLACHMITVCSRHGQGWREPRHRRHREPTQPVPRHLSAFAMAVWLFEHLAKQGRVRDFEAYNSRCCLPTWPSFCLFVRQPSCCFEACHARGDYSRAGCGYIFLTSGSSCP